MLRGENASDLPVIRSGAAADYSVIRRGDCLIAASEIADYVRNAADEVAPMHQSLAVVSPRSVIGRGARWFGCGDAARIKELVFDLHRYSM
jgi:hypothetical protein